MVKRRNTDIEGALIVLIIGKILLSTWLIMLILGMFAGYMAMPGLAIGFWATLGIFTMINLAFVKLTTS